MESIGAENTGVARRYETFRVAAGDLTLCLSDPHSAVEAAGSAVLVRCSGPITQDVGAGEVKVHFPLLERIGESRPMLLV